MGMIFLIKNKQFDLVGCQCELIDEMGRIIGNLNFPTTEKNVYFGLKYKMPTVGHIWLAKRDTYTKIQKYRYPTAEDYDFLLRMKTLGLRFTNVKDILYKIRIRNGNTSTTQGFLQRTTAEFVYKSYQERLKYGYEVSTNFISFQSSFFYKIRKFFFDKSNQLFIIANKFNNYLFLKYILILFSIILSPIEQTKHILNRYKFKKL
jgi:hypothetical protein